jgi:peroxiredoxin
MLLFWNPGCGFCNRMVEDVKAFEANPPAGAPQLLIVSTGTPEANRAQGLRAPMLLDQGFATGRQFGAGGTPSAVLIDANGNIASGVAVGAPAVLDMAYNRAIPPVQAAAPAGGNGAAAPARPAPAQPLAPMAARVGQKAPNLKLPDLDGNEIDLADFRGDKTMLLFWNPGCGFCRRMADDLKALEANPPANAPKLLVVSTGAADANRATGLASTILLDQNFTVGRQFGASGTPSAVLIDAKGNIASQVAVGAPAVLALAGVKDSATA